MIFRRGLCPLHLGLRAMACGSGGSSHTGQPSLRLDSCSSDDDIVLSGGGSVQPSRVRGQHDVPVSDGPLTLALLVGQPKRRWGAEAHGGSLASQRLLKALTRAAGAYGAAISADTHFVAGVAVVRKWRFVRGAVSHHHVWDMVEACKALHRFRSGQRFIEHEIIASATICVDDGSFVAVPPEVAAMPARIGGQRALSRIESASAAFLVTKGALSGQRGRVRDLLAMWRERYHIHDAECMARPATPSALFGHGSGGLVW